MTNSKNTITTKSKSDLITTNQADTICEKLTRGLTLTEILEEKQYQFITFLANKLTDLYSDNKVQNVKTDQSIKISWEDNQTDMIDVSEDIVDIPSDNKD